MLKDRIITAVVISGAFLALLVYVPTEVFAYVIVGLVALAAWEWANLSGLTQVWQRLAYALLMAVSLLACYAFSVFVDSPVLKVQRVEYLMIAAGFFWLLAVLWVLRYPASTAFWGSRAMRSGLGFSLLLPTGVGLVYLKQQQTEGQLIMLVVAIIACADIGAYFSGKRFGKHKLAVRVSPGKTWEGVIGGLSCNVVFAFILALFLNLSSLETVLLVLVFMLTSVVSVVGDLFESMVKRHRGVKDSGKLLPGHGGILDRIDGWTAALPIFTLAYVLYFPIAL